MTMAEAFGDPTRDEYRDAFRECMLRLLDYETGRTPGPASTALTLIIDADARAQVEGR